MTSEILKKNTKLNIPIKISLTDNGVEFFIHNKKKVSQIRLADNDLVYGLNLFDISFEYLHKLIKQNLISKIETSSVEFNTKKNNIIDLTKLVTYQFIYNRFYTGINNAIMESTFIFNWNRANPGKTIDEKTRLNSGFIINFIDEKKTDRINILKLFIHDLLKHLNEIKTLTDNEKEDKINTAKKMLCGLPPFIWFVIIYTKNSKEYKFIYESIIKNLYESLEKTKIADYLGFMIVELVNNAESIKVQKTIKQYYRNNNTEKFILNKEIREQIYEVLKQKNENIHITWKLCGKDTVIGQNNQLKVTIVNKGYNYRELKNEIAEKLNKNLRSKNLYDFYKEIPEENLSREFGFYYFTYLNEACKENNIRFESFVNKILGDDFPIITLLFNFK